jgi:hypothetical protein
VSRLVGAFICPRGVSAIEYRVTGKGIEVIRAFDQPARISSERQATDHLLRILQEAGIRKAAIALTIRGFGVVHHMLALPPARDEVLSPIVDRELKRLEPQLDDPRVGWTGLPLDPAEMTDAPPQRQVLAAAVPKHVGDTIGGAIEAGGHRLAHFTVVPAAAQRLHEEFVPDGSPSALVAPLHDGAFLGFFLGGALRLAVEPPLPDGDYLDAGAIAEEVELGAMFVRQQFRGAQVARVVVAAPSETFIGAEGVINERLQVPVTRFTAQHLSAGALIALGGVINSRSASPLSLSGPPARQSATGLLVPMSFAALALAIAVGAFTVIEAFRARDAFAELQKARQQIDAQAFGLSGIRETADQRRLIRDAVEAMRLSSRDRRELQNGLSTLSGSIIPPIRLDSLQLDRGANGWVSGIAGSVTAESNARSVELLHEFYRDLPRRLGVEELSLGQLSYADSDAGSGEPGSVRFQISFVIPYLRSQ